MHPDNDFTDPWIVEKFEREGMDIPQRIFPKMSHKREA